MVAIYAVWYNWLRIHKTPRVTPAMAAGLSKTVTDWSDIIALMDAEAPKPGPRPLQERGRRNFKLTHYPRKSSMDPPVYISSFEGAGRDRPTFIPRATN
jgi:hypothetical protein